MAWAHAQPEAFEEEQRVTAVDVWVERGGEGKKARGAARELPRGLGPDDFEVHVGGKPLPVLSVDTIDSAEPWRLVAYFDLTTSSTRTARWAASALSAELPGILALGSLEIVVADPEPMTVLAATRDREMAAAILAGLALEAEGGSELIERRVLFVEGTRAAAPGEAAAIGASLAAWERQAAAHRMADLVEFLAGGSSAAGGRAVFLVCDGFDPRPEDFYLADPAGETAVEDSELASQDAKASQAAPGKEPLRPTEPAALLAAYGWITFAVAPPEPDAGLVPGRRIGKWRFNRPKAKDMDGFILRRLVPIFVATREANREPETAEGYLELGRAFLAGGDAEKAEEAFEKALYHFSGDKRTAKHQAEAKAGLALALMAQGESGRAQKALRDAVELDPERAAEFPAARAVLEGPLEPLEQLVKASAGRLVQDEEELGEAVASLSRRVRLTYQVSGPPEGRMAELAVAFRDRDMPLRLPQWSRSGTPDGVAEARVRRLLMGDFFDGDLALELTVEGGDLVAYLEPPDTAEPDSRGGERELRVTVGTGSPEHRHSIGHERKILTIDASEPWVYRMPLDSLDADLWTAVVVEDLETGLWGAAVLEENW